MKWFRRLRITALWFKDGSAESLLRAIENVHTEGRALNFADNHPYWMAIEGCHDESGKLRRLLALWNEGD
jgi:hypothetical protein